MTIGDISLVLVGAGKMGGAMLAGWLDMGLDASKTVVIDPSQPEEIAKAATDKGFTLASSAEGVDAPDMVVIAIKPQMMDKVLPGLKAMVGPKTVVVSVAAGTPVATFKAHFGADALVVRAMPNTPAQVGRGMTAAFASAGVDAAMKEVTATLLSSMGAFVWVGDEGQMDAVTAISGSGPAYVFHMVEAMAKAGEALGLAPDVAALLARQTVVGAGELMHQSDLDAATLRTNVTSPGGTTAAALAVLMDEGSGLPPLMAKATEAARDRSIELSM
ncbi:pyrroline-5-carboxylate reductase [Cohaesibacter intestini]|uniref:pyrroline-5-carboxylate reductase n=1 Tax=Cohaesibacter intestini TaxID=2211145 RepID=UPI000DE843F3|nr:pyrroline-5-carboxylate reductase [Cohaesibacter intestini]